MALDGLYIRAIVRELQGCVGGRINKIHQPNGHDIVMQIRAQGSSGRLLLSANPTYPRVHLTDSSFVNPMEAPMFCMLMRKHCENGVIESIEQVGLERIIHIQVRQRDELGDLSVRRIVVELMGRHSNIILLDPASGVVLDGIHHVTPAISSYRVVLPGSAYTAPPDQNKRNPLLMEEALFREALRHDADKRPEEALVAAYSGISPLNAREIAHLAQTAGEEQCSPEDRLWSAFRQTMERLAGHRYSPNTVTVPNGGKSFFSVLPLTHVDGEKTDFASPSACLESYYGDKAERDVIKQRTSDLLKLLNNELSKNRKKLEKLKASQEEGKEADKYRILGELLTASMHTVSKGQEWVEVINYYEEDQPAVKIELDPLLTPSENAQRYFRKYTKAKNSLQVLQEQMDNTVKDSAYLQSVLHQLEQASMLDIGEIRDELAELGYVRRRSEGRRKPNKKTGKPSLTCYQSSEGVPIYVGKNNTQNEYLTNRLAQPGDTWLHTKDIPGSHVVIRDSRYGRQTLEEAAVLAAYYSQARESSRVPVDYTLIRHVRKPGGAKPGFVIYEQQKTLFVTPDPELVKQLPMTVK